MEENKVGRPTAMTPEVVLKLEQAFAIDSTVEEACSYAEIARNTFYEYLKKNPTFQDRIDDLRQRPILKARQTIAKSLEQPENAKWYLERKRKSEFAQRSELTGAEGKDIRITGIEYITPNVKDNANTNGETTPSLPSTN